MLSGLIHIANAQTPAARAAVFGNIVNPIIDNIVTPIIMLLFAVATVVFVYGVIQIMLKPADAEEHQKGKMAMVSGIIGMFIMISAWGIVYLVSDTVGSF